MDKDELKLMLLRYLNLNIRIDSRSNDPEDNTQTLSISLLWQQTGQDDIVICEDKVDLPRLS